MPGLSFSQDTGILYGHVTDNEQKPVEFANVYVQDYSSGTTTDKSGYYEIKISSGKEVTIIISCVGYKTGRQSLVVEAGSRKEFNYILDIQAREIGEISVSGNQIQKTNMSKIDPRIIQFLPDASGNFESILKTFPGVSSNNELSSQYSVRGGNFDENLVYVNDIEIYRPFLIRSGQQEGLSFINPDMVSSVLFSAGGFDAKYGDKMSSVLDITYKKPVAFSSSVSFSLLGGSVEAEGSSDNHRFTYITGVRYKTSQYLLKSMDVQGDYNPSFSDVQSFMTYDVSEHFEVNFLGNYARNKYQFKPVTRETTFGTINQALKLKIYFDGHEIDDFNTALGAISGIWHPNENLKITNTLSAFNTQESETYDIQGQYYLNELETNFGSSSMGDSLNNIGIGTFLNHARNYLNASVISFSHNGFVKLGRHMVLWGAKYQNEQINDKISEWELLDSAGYSLPYHGDSVRLQKTLQANNSLSSNRMMAYFQDTYRFYHDSAEYNITTGIRANYWDLNDQLIVSPRVSASLKPAWERDVVFRFSTGFYYQPPFYRELLDINYNINKHIRAQESIHFVFSSDYYFKAWNRPFKMVTEAYYKILNNLIPYDIDNVSLRYYGSNNSKGYAAGLDMKINGEFVSGVDSWASLSLMKTDEIVSGNYIYKADSSATVKGNTGYIPRPTDQLINFGLFFQDYFPNNPSYRMQLSLLFGSGLPFGPPDSHKQYYNFRMPPYRRVDLGFSKVIKSEDQVLPGNNMLHYFKSLWIDLEIFNILDINNTISYLWITDVNNQQYAVPNYLTSRRLNIKVTAKF
ncbi:MAG: TonB-dependent receptor [Bacteroidia bacterium]|nr:TonB-dependent receptor [Bacteroidia bacterium]